MIFDKYPKYREQKDRHFWAQGYYVNTVGRNEAEIKKYIAEQLDSDRIEDRISQ